MRTGSDHAVALLVTIAAIGGFALSRCRRGNDRPHREDTVASASRNAPDAATVAESETPISLDQCRRQPPLEVDALVLDWTEEDVPYRLTVRRDGTVACGSSVVLRVVGACLLDAGGTPIVWVASSGEVHARDAAQRGRFEAHADVRTSDGRRLAFGDVSRLPDGTHGITDDGSLWIVDGPEATSLPRGVSGFVPGARRLALLLDSLTFELRACRTGGS